MRSPRWPTLHVVELVGGNFAESRSESVDAATDQEAPARVGLSAKHFFRARFPIAVLTCTAQAIRTSACGRALQLACEFEFANLSEAGRCRAG